MLVPVRAITPVAGMPPNSGEAMLATPCASTSMFERCRVPAIVSAATADRSNSTPTRKAMVKADGRTLSTFVQGHVGQAGRRQ